MIKYFTILISLLVFNSSYSSQSCIDDCSTLTKVCSRKTQKEVCDCISKHPIKFIQDNDLNNFNSVIRRENIKNHLEALKMLAAIDSTCASFKIIENKVCFDKNKIVDLTSLTQQLSSSAECPVKWQYSNNIVSISGLDCLKANRSCFGNDKDFDLWLLLSQNLGSTPLSLKNAQISSSQILKYIENIDVFSSKPFDGLPSFVLLNPVVQNIRDMLEIENNIEGFRKSLKNFIEFNQLIVKSKNFPELIKESQSLVKLLSFEVRSNYCPDISRSISRLLCSNDHHLLNPGFQNSLYKDLGIKEDCLSLDNNPMSCVDNNLNCYKFRALTCSAITNSRNPPKLFYNESEPSRLDKIDLSFNNKKIFEEIVCGDFNKILATKCSRNADYNKCSEKELSNYISQNPSSILAIRTQALEELKVSNPDFYKSLKTVQRSKESYSINENGELTKISSADSSITTSSKPIQNQDQTNPSISNGSSTNPQFIQFQQLTNSIQDKTQQLKKAESDLREAQTAAQRDKYADELAKLREEIRLLKEQKDGLAAQKTKGSTESANSDSNGGSRLANGSGTSANLANQRSTATAGVNPINQGASPSVQSSLGSSGNFPANGSIPSSTVPTAASVTAALPPMGTNLNSSASPNGYTNGLILNRDVPAKSWNEMLKEIQSFKAGNEELKKENAFAIDIDEKYAQRPEAFIKENAQKLTFNKDGVAYMGLIYRKADSTKAVYYRIEKDITSSNPVFKIIELGKKAHEDIRTYYSSFIKSIMKR